MQAGTIGRLNHFTLSNLERVALRDCPVLNYVMGVLLVSDHAGWFGYVLLMRCPWFLPKQIIRDLVLSCTTVELLMNRFKLICLS